MSEKVAEKPEKAEAKVKDLPNNNKETQEPQAEMPQPQPDPEKQPEPESFTISKQGVDDLVTCLNEVIASKYVKQTVFNVINANFVPVFKK